MNYEKKFKREERWNYVFICIILLLLLLWGFDINDHSRFRKELQECKEGKGIYRLEVECIKYDNKGWINSTTITTHIHSFKYYQTYSDYKEMVEGYEECEVRE
ncbi:hypothetical protein LCGC14_0571010 [marine sediment metagenome]|uniref:Uncharacterized protein n=1 Tax=marine sediment metagenome TaxID=412755 RepID=A0A0F9USA8_9ZZZZ